MPPQCLPHVRNVSSCLHPTPSLKNIPEDEVGINEDINFIEDDEITEDNSIDVEVIDEDK